MSLNQLIYALSYNVGCGTALILFEDVKWRSVTQDQVAFYVQWEEREGPKMAFFGLCNNNFRVPLLVSLISGLC